MENEYILEFPPSDDEFCRIAELQKRWAVDIAGKLDRGEKLTDVEAMFTSTVLEHWAKWKETERLKPRGKQPQVNASEVALEAYRLLYNGDAPSITTAIAMLAEKHGVTNQAMTKAVKKKGAAADRYWSVRFRKKIRSLDSSNDEDDGEKEAAANRYWSVRIATK